VPGTPNVSMVVYCLVRRKVATEAPVQFLLRRTGASLTFPPTKLSPGESLREALARPMEGDVGLPPGSYFAEEELPMIPNDASGPSYEGLKTNWYLYPIDVSLADAAWESLEDVGDGIGRWATLDEIVAEVREPNVRAISGYLRRERPDLLRHARTRPSMDALAGDWAGRRHEGVRVARGAEVRQILDAGSRALNLRVADPYLPYQRQGLGFTWSFFTPKDKQDVHVHGLPAVEIYGVLEGTLQIWHKPMSERGAHAWRCDTIRAGDWAEVEPLHCHFACWAGPEGLGTVFKAAATGELAGVGKIGAAGKTICSECNVRSQCHKHPRMEKLAGQYALEFGDRDYRCIEAIIAGGVDA